MQEKNVWSSLGAPAAPLEMAPSAAPGAPARALAARIARGSLRARPIPSRVASVRVDARAGGGRRPTVDAPPQNEDDSAARPTAVARLTASLGASTSTRRDIHVGRRADAKAARRERRDAKHARELGPHLGSANSPASVDAAMSRELAAMAGGVDALARRARDLALANERNLEVALRLASAAADVAAEELRDASLEAEADLDWPESSSSSGHAADARAGSFHGSFDDASRTAAAERRTAEARRERLSACAESVSDLSSRLSKRLLHDEWSATIAAFAAKDWHVDRKKPRVRPKDRRCNQPKARQGWNKRAMRETGVRVCVGCERMLPTTELIRVARMADVDDGEGDEIDEKTEKESRGDESIDEEKEKKKNGGKCKWSVAIDPGSVAGSDALLRMLVDPRGRAADAAKHPAASAAAKRALLRRDRNRARAGDSNERTSEVDLGFNLPRHPARRPTNALQGRAVYVCRRGACARAAFDPKTRRAHRALRAAGAYAAAFASAVEDVCVAAEIEDGVDSSRWVLERAARDGGGTPGRWSRHPRYLDERNGAEAEGSDQTFLVWAAERSDFGTRRTNDW